MSRHTKIVCTLGPSSNSPELIERLLEAGMDVVRLNFSHGTHEDHAATIGRVREKAAEKHRFVPIVADLQGPKIRTGKLDGGGPVELVAGSRIRLVPEGGSDGATGTADRLGIDYRELARAVRPSDRILLADGEIELRVEELSGVDVVCTVVNGGPLGERKGVNLPGVALALPSLAEHDKADLQFALAHKADYIALSFVREPRDLRLAKNLIEWAGAGTPVIAKLEKPEALEHLDEILEVADGVMVARGDLGVEMPPAQVPIEQKRIIARAAALRKPVITATQMLESMITSPRPTRAEASDVANAVFDGSDAVMLSGETAVGRYPVEAVRMMAEIIERAENSEIWGAYALAAAGAADKPVALSDAVAQTAVSLSAKLGVKLLVVYTESGYTARLVSKHRPACTILGLSRHGDVCLQMGLLWGVRPHHAREIADLDQLVLSAEAIAVGEGLAARGDWMCLVAGTPFSVPGKTDLIKLHRIGHPSH
ncbi:MAG TPA: pyruvate kinase [Bryobacterales bacterium]|nr:pyruvate kinase [Bryobacterales bacterium]